MSRHRLTSWREWLAASAVGRRPAPNGHVRQATGRTPAGRSSSGYRLGLKGPPTPVSYTDVLVVVYSLMAAGPSTPSARGLPQSHWEPFRPVVRR